jgi:hypothetical protein
VKKIQVLLGVDPEYVDGLEVFLGADEISVGVDGCEVSLRFVLDSDIAIKGQIAIYLIADLAGKTKERRRLVIILFVLLTYVTYQP